jgi:hypothetical protein
LTNEEQCEIIENMEDLEEFWDDEFPEITEEEFWSEGIGEDIETRTVIVMKGGVIGLLCLKTSPGTGTIFRIDPREKPAVQMYTDPEKATEWFNKSLRTTKKNGWKVCYSGKPLFG